MIIIYKEIKSINTDLFNERIKIILSNTCYSILVYFVRISGCCLRISAKYATNSEHYHKESSSVLESSRSRTRGKPQIWKKSGRGRYLISLRFLLVIKYANYVLSKYSGYKNNRIHTSNWRKNFLQIRFWKAK